MKVENLEYKEKKQPISVHEALKQGRCDRCVAYFPGEPVPPFSTHCHSTRLKGRLRGSIILCTKGEKP